MTKYSIAGLCIQFDGETNDYFDFRLSDYLCANPDMSVDISVKCEICNHIEPPKGTIVANINQRTWLITDTGYASFDYDPMLNICLAMVVTDKHWKQIDVQLYDIKNLLHVDDMYRIYNMLGEVFRFAILSNNGIIIHSSAIDYDENGVIFSAPSKTGKSTHAGLWKSQYPQATTILNDDTPAIRLIDGVPYVFGTPWSGKTTINCNKSAPLKAIIFLQQSSTNVVKELNGAQAIARLINEIRHPVIEDMMQLSLAMADKLLKDIPTYLLLCNISVDAVNIVKNKIGI